MQHFQCNLFFKCLVVKNYGCATDQNYGTKLFLLVPPLLQLDTNGQRPLKCVANEPVRGKYYCGGLPLVPRRCLIRGT